MENVLQNEVRKGYRRKTDFWQKRCASDYSYDYQGQYSEKDPVTGLNNFELRMYDGRIGRWISKDPAGQFATPYEGMGNNPVSSVDPNGGLIIFVNGFHDPGLFQKEYDNANEMHNEYWQGFDTKIENFYRDHNALYADGNGSINTAERRVVGYVWAINNEQAIIRAHNQGEKIIIISHSMGTAFANGIQERLLEIGIKPDLKVGMAVFLMDANLNFGRVRTLQFANKHDKITGWFNQKFNGMDVSRKVNSNSNFWA